MKRMLMNWKLEYWIDDRLVIIGAVYSHGTPQQLLKFDLPLLTGGVPCFAFHSSVRNLAV